MKQRRQNTDEALRALERYHLDHLDDPVGLSKLVRGLARVHGTKDAITHLRDLWVENDIEVEGDDFTAVAIALMPTGNYDLQDMDTALGAVNDMALEWETETTDEEDRDQDQRNPEWRARRYHELPLPKGPMRAHWASGYHYSPMGRLLSVQRWSDVRHGSGLNAWVLWVRDVDPPFPTSTETEEGRLSNMLMAWAMVQAHGARIRMSGWALIQMLKAASRVAKDTDSKEAIGEGRSVVNLLTYGAGTKILTKKAAESLIGGKAQRTEEQGHGVEHWVSSNKNELNVHEFSRDRLELNDMLDQQLRALFQVTPYPFHVRESELEAYYHEERGDESLELVWVDPKDESNEETIARWTNEPIRAFEESEEEGDEEVYDEEGGELGGLVRDGFLDPRDWRGTAARYCQEGGWLEIDS